MRERPTDEELGARGGQWEGEVAIFVALEGIAGCAAIKVGVVHMAHTVQRRELEHCHVNNAESWNGLSVFDQEFRYRKMDLKEIRTYPEHHQQ